MLLRLLIINAFEVWDMYENISIYPIDLNVEDADVLLLIKMHITEK